MDNNLYRFILFLRPGDTKRLSSQGEDEDKTKEEEMILSW